jgi:hypothetical protein
MTGCPVASSRSFFLPSPRLLGDLTLVSKSAVLSLVRCDQWRRHGTYWFDQIPWRHTGNVSKKNRREKVFFKSLCTSWQLTNRNLQQTCISEDLEPQRRVDITEQNHHLLQLVSILRVRFPAVMQWTAVGSMAKWPPHQPDSEILFCCLHIAGKFFGHMFGLGGEFHILANHCSCQSTLSSHARAYFFTCSILQATQQMYSSFFYIFPSFFIKIFFSI